MINTEYGAAIGPNDKPPLQSTVVIGKAQTACAQSFALWQQTTKEFTRHNHSLRTLFVTFNRTQVNIDRASTPRSLYYCLFAPRIYSVFLHAHSVRGEPRIPAQCQRSGCNSTVFVKCWRSTSITCVPHLQTSMLQQLGL